MRTAILFLYLPFLVSGYRCINIYGLEVPQEKFVCSWQNNMDWYLDKAREVIEIDSVRLPFSYEYMSCSNKTLMDDFVRLCQRKGIDVILDYHRGYSDHQGSSPVEDKITYDMWVDMLTYTLDRYESYSVVKAIGLFNEFQTTNKTYVEDLQRRAVEELEERFPNRFEYMLGCADWSKDCSGMWTTLPNNRSWIEMHSYGFAKGLLPSNTNRVFVGEIGWRHNESSQFNEFRLLVKKKRIKNMCLWTLAHSHDTDNLFYNDCVTINQEISQGFNSLFDQHSIQCLRGIKSQ